MSPAYVLDPMELDEHVPVYVPEPEHPEYHVPSDDDIQVKDQPYADDASPIVESPGHIADSKSMEEDSIDYLDEPEDDDEDLDEDPEEDHIDYPADGEDGDDEPSNDDNDDKDEDLTKDEEEEEHLALADYGQGLIRSPGHDAWTIARAADRVEDVGYVRVLQASEHRMMTSIEEVSYQAQ
ncbi:hypothetical protein Tco_0036605, partial [Tanacetum coccineum]